MVDQQNLYTLAEAAERTGLSVEALRLRIKPGKLEGIRGNDGLRVRLTSADLEAIEHQQANQQNPALTQQKPTLVNIDANSLKALEAAVGVLRDRAERAEARADAAQGVADRRGEELVSARERAGRAEGGSETLREQLKAERNRSVTQMREVEAARDAANTELAQWTAGGPLARALRALLYRRGRA